MIFISEYISKYIYPNIYSFLSIYPVYIETKISRRYLQFHVHCSIIHKMDTIKDRNSMDLTETEHIQMRWQKYTEELHKKDLKDPDNHKGVITHIKPATFFLSTYTNLHSYQWFIEVSFLHNLVNNYLRAR